MKSRIITIVAGLFGLISIAGAQSRFRPDPDPAVQITLTESTTTLASTTEAVFGAEFNYTDKGAVITFIYPNTPAETFHFKTDDIITAIGNVTINSEAAYKQALNSYKPEESVTISYIRKNVQKTKKVILDKVTVYKKPISADE
jgi:S1-C subfamily serine protease